MPRNCRHPCGQRQSGIACPVGCIFLKVDHPARALQEVGERTAGRLDGVDGTHVPPRNRMETFIFLTSQPERASRAFDQVGERLDRGFLQAVRGIFRGERPSEPQPLFAVIVAE